ncbi:MAG: beta-galactosidase [Candidatus Obscuribacterales bacterium]|nr:beta-galactosidase [Candidatus Obscuribacterales bacterium]
MQTGSSNSKRNILKIIVLFVTSFTTVFSFSTQIAAAASSRLVFVTADCDANTMSTIESLAALPNIDGLGIAISWYNIEKQPGKYSWTVLDGAIRAAAKHKKYVTLYLVTTPKPPDWLIEGGKAQTFACGNFTRGVVIDAVPWDRVYLNAYTQFLQAAALHFKSLNMTPYIFAVGMVAPQRDCTITGSMNGRLGTVAYNRASYLLACKQMVDTYARLFPTARQFVPAPGGEMICRPTRDPEFFAELMTYAINKHKQGCWMFSRDLSSAGSRNAAQFTTFNQRTGIAYQVPSSTPEEASPTNFARAINIGLANGALYFEISPAVAVNGDGLVQQAINLIHRN